MSTKDHTYTGLDENGQWTIKTVQPPNPRAMAIYTAFKAALDAEALLDKAISNVPDYLPTSQPIDCYGDELSAFHEAVNALGKALDNP